MGRGWYQKEGGDRAAWGKARLEEVKALGIKITAPREAAGSI